MIIKIDSDPIKLHALDKFRGFLMHLIGSICVDGRLTFSDDNNGIRETLTPF